MKLESKSLLLIGVIVIAFVTCGRTDLIYTPPPSECGNGRIDSGEECDDGNRVNGDGCSSDCRREPVLYCGNGRIDSGEECDDGNRVSGDGCSESCRREAAQCGNRRVEEGEECDDGNRLPGDGCDPLCRREQPPECGNGRIEPGEECDDGNRVAEDGCDENCRLEIPPGCGNGVLEPGEACDDGNNVSGDGCSSNCLSTEICGNGYIDRVVGEECDRNNLGGYRCEDFGYEGGTLLCSNRCTFDTSQCISGAVCGNGRVEPGEECDDGNRVAGDGCNEYCRREIPLSCGNGVIDPGEECDTNNFGGLSCHDFGYTGGSLICTRLCTIDTSMCNNFVECGNGILEPGEVCDDGNHRSGDGCSADCLSNETCGNRYVDTVRGEVCDDGNNISGDGCSADCLSNETCGNGYVDTAVGEECDDGNNRNGDGCDSNCRNERCLVDYSLGILPLNTEVSRDVVTTGASNENSSCNSSTTTGGDIVLSFSVVVQGNLEVRIYQTGDHTIGIYSASEIKCDAQLRYCADPMGLNYRTFTYNNFQPGDYYLIVDAVSNSTEGNVRVGLILHGEQSNCGNGRIDQGEVCDDGNQVSGDGCSSDCLSNETCGNNYIDTVRGEVCDDGNNISGDGCSADCRSEETCGNGYVDTAVGEVCDDGNRRSGDGCSADCLSNETCGNGYVDTVRGEECDDGNNRNGDGCDSNCLLEHGLCYIDRALGTLRPGDYVNIDIDVTRVGDEWVTSCTQQGSRDYALTFSINRVSDVEVIYYQTGHHAMGLYTENEVSDICLATGGICFSYDPNASGDVIFMGRTPGEYYLLIEAQGQTGAGRVNLSIYVWGCQPAVDLGNISGTTQQVTINTGGGTNIYTPGCSGTSGREVVIGFVLSYNNSRLSVTYTQTGDHVIGLFEEGGGRCDQYQISCYDLQGNSSGSLQFTRLSAGPYFLIVDAFEPGREGNVNLTITASP